MTNSSQIKTPPSAWRSRVKDSFQDQSGQARIIPIEMVATSQRNGSGHRGIEFGAKAVTLPCTAHAQQWRARELGDFAGDIRTVPGAAQPIDELGFEMRSRTRRQQHNFLDVRL